MSKERKMIMRKVYLTAFFAYLGFRTTGEQLQAEAKKNDGYVILNYADVNIWLEKRGDSWLLSLYTQDKEYGNWLMRDQIVFTEDLTRSQMEETLDKVERLKDEQVAC